MNKLPLDILYPLVVKLFQVNSLLYNLEILQPLRKELRAFTHRFHIDTHYYAISSSVDSHQETIVLFQSNIRVAKAFPPANISKIFLSSKRSQVVCIRICIYGLINELLRTDFFFSESTAVNTVPGTCILWTQYMKVRNRMLKGQF